jgi:hypothetical protein
LISLRERVAQALYGLDSAGGWAGCPGGCAEKYRRRADRILAVINEEKIMGQIVRANSAIIDYENGAVLAVTRVGKSNRFSWGLRLRQSDGGTFESMGETMDVEGMSAGIHQAMVAAAAIFSQVDAEVLEGGSDGE